MFFGRELLIGLLALGTVAGYSAGLASFARCARGHHEARRAAFEAHVAEVCTRAAHRVAAREGLERDDGFRAHEARHAPRAAERWPSE